MYVTCPSLDQPFPLEYFKLKRYIVCLPLLEPRIFDDNLKKLKQKRRKIKRETRRLLIKK